jgi:RNA polymerase sigma-70 factor (ECF subfamily)
MAELNDESVRLLAEARGGSGAALGRLFEGCRNYLLLVARRELDPDLQAKGGASDLVQETFLEAQRDFAQFQGESEADLLAWLRRLLLNNLANFTRSFRGTSKRSVEREAPLLSPGSSPGPGLTLADKGASPSECALAREQADEVGRLLARLPDDYRQVLTLRFQEGLAFEEIGRRMGRSPNAVRKLWARAVERFQQEMQTP